MKLNKKYIIFFCLLVVLVIIAIIFLLLGKEKRNKETDLNPNINEETYTAYININPLVKLIFKVSCDEDICTDLVTDYELVNEDAKELFADVNLKSKSFQDTLSLIGSTVEEKNINFSEIEIYTDYNNEDFFVNQSNNWEVKVNVSKTDDLNNVTSNLEEEYISKTIFTYITQRNMSDDVLVSIIGVDPEYGFKGTFSFSRGDCLPTWKFIIKGPKDVIDQIKSTYPADVDTSNYSNCFDLADNNYSVSYDHFSPYVDLSNLGAGKHKLNIMFDSDLPDITVLNQTWAEIEIVDRDEFLQE